MSLRLRYETPPNVEILHRPAIRPGQENVMWHDVVVPKRWDHRHCPLVGAPILVFGVSKDFCELVDHELILAQDLFLGTRELFIVIVPGRVACPNDKVYVIFDIVADPVKRLVYERIRRIAT